MGDIIGGVIGGIGSLFGGQSAKSNAYKGFSYLTNSPIGQTYLPNGGQANAAQSDLLGLGKDPHAFDNAFGQYKNSTGFKFQLQQGQNAINSNAASRGVLNSGGTGKALMKYGQGLASTTFNNYLGQLGGVANQGLQAGNMIGTAGTEGGATAAKAAAGSSNGIFGALGDIAGMFL